MPQRRPNIVTIRLSDAGLKAIQDRADAMGVPVSQVIRMMLSFAAEKMPPPRRTDDPFR